MTGTSTLEERLAADGWRQRTLPGFASRMGPLWTRKEDPNWAYGILATADHLNPAGMVHGGLVTALMDHALSAIGWESLGRRACVTVQLDTQFIAAGREGDFLEARGRVVRATASLVFMQGQVTVGGSEVAMASAVLKVMARDRPKTDAGPPAS